MIESSADQNRILSPTVCPIDSHVEQILTDTALQAAQGLLLELLSKSLIRRYDWEHLPVSIRQGLAEIHDDELLLHELVVQNLITDYQANRIRLDQKFGLILGHYRILCPLGSGSMGQVFKAEHLRLPKYAAIKTQKITSELEIDLVRRFENESWTVAQLEHRNIVGALDAGEIVDPDSASTRLLYFVMEYVPGRNLEEMVKTDGPFSRQSACHLVFQSAAALQEIDRLGLIHRDIKPSNIIMTPDGTVKLLDFGLSRQYDSRITRPGAWLGTVDYLAPEQAQDASSVDIRADLYSLGATLYWCLTGRTPFVSSGRIVEDFIRRSKMAPPSIQDVRPDLPVELSQVVAKMMAVHPGDRYQNPAAVRTALIPFLESRKSDHRRMPVAANNSDVSTQQTVAVEAPRKRRVLIVDDESTVRKCVKLSLISEGIECDEASNGDAALNLLNENRYDLILTDIEMPVLTGMELLSVIRNRMDLGNLKVLVFSGRSSPNEMARLMSAGADDYLVKPLSIVQLRSRVNAALRLKESQDAAHELNRKLFEANQVMEQSLSSLGGQLKLADQINSEKNVAASTESVS